MPFALSHRERLVLIALSIALGVIFAFGFLPTAARLAMLLPALGNLVSAPARTALAFPLLAFVFWISLLPSESARGGRGAVWRLVPLPLVLALLSGPWVPGPRLAELDWSRQALIPLWIWLCGPLGEELLFRGWLYEVLFRLFAERSFTVTNPLPAPIWGSAIAFSLWHLQNGFTPLVGWQITYTLVVGLWLGVLRWRSGSLLPPLVAHAGINACAMVL